MNILLTNDDGILADGIIALSKALSQVADVYIFAPKDQKSASGHGITIGRSMTVEEMDLPPAKHAYAVGGTPADCVRLGIYFLEQSGVVIDKVVSGANHGLNLGTDTLYSGTVSAAVEGIVNKKPSIAISLGAVAPTDFTMVSKIAVMAANLPPDIHDASAALSFNIPHPPREIKGIRVTQLGRMDYKEVYTEKEAEGNLRAFVYSGKPVFDDNLLPGTDVEGYVAGYITVTPLQFDLTNYLYADKLREKFIDF